MRIARVRSSEPNGDASISRFQLLIFTFVVGFGLFLVIAGKKDFPEIPGSVLSLLGISASSYLVSKGIQFSRSEGVEDRPPQVTVMPGSLKVIEPNKTTQFQATVIRATNTQVTWSLHPDDPAVEVGSIDPNSGLYRSPDPLPPPNTLATVKATSVADASAFGTAAVTFAAPAGPPPPQG